MCFCKRSHPSFVYYLCVPAIESCLISVFVCDCILIRRERLILFFDAGYELFFDIKDSLLKVIGEPFDKENCENSTDAIEYAKIKQLKEELFPFIVFTSLFDEDQNEGCDQNDKPSWLQDRDIINCILNKRSGRYSILKKYLNQIALAVKNLVDKHKNQGREEQDCLMDSDSDSVECELDKKEKVDDKLIDHVTDRRPDGKNEGFEGGLEGKQVGPEGKTDGLTDINAVKGRSRTDSDLEGVVKIESGNDKEGETDVTVEGKFIGDGMDYDNKPGVDALRKNDTDYAKSEEVVRMILDKNNGESVKAECSKIYKSDKGELKFEQLPTTNHEEGSNNEGRPPVNVDSANASMLTDSEKKDEIFKECNSVTKEKILADDFKSKKNSLADKCPIKVEERETKPLGEKTTSEIEDQKTVEVVKQTKSGAIDEKLEGNPNGLQEHHQRIKERISFEEFLETCNYPCLVNYQRKFEEEIQNILKVITQKFSLIKKCKLASIFFSCVHVCM